MNGDELQSRLENLPKQAADYINAVIKKMRYRKKVRNEVWAELIDHFEDELKDCKKEEEREVKAKELIESFGDIKLLGVLLRRAKKRCRPLWRTVTARFFQTVGLLLILFILYLAWFMTGKPVITTNYVAELNLAVRPTADESENAGPLYIQAAELVKDKPNGIKELMGKDYEEFTDDDKKRCEQWLEDNKQIFELVFEGSQKSHYWIEYESDDENRVMSVLLPHLSEYRSIAWCLLIRSRLAAEKENFEDSITDLITSYRFGRNLRGNFILVEQLVGTVIETLSLETVREILNEYDIGSVTLAKLDSDLAALIGSEDFTVKFETEKLFMYDEIQRCFTDDVLGGHLSLRAFSTMETLGELSSVNLSKSFLEKIHFERIPHILFTHPNKKESLVMTDRYFDYIASVSHKSPAQLHREGIDIRTEAMEIIKGNLLLEILSPAVDGAMRIGYRNKVNSFATVTIIALHRYQTDKGQFPDSLEELKQAGFIEELPIDPWSDEPLIYSKTEEDFILYSVGLNFVDDGGVMITDNRGRTRLWTDKGDWVFWPVEKGD